MGKVAGILGVIVVFIITVIVVNMYGTRVEVPPSYHGVILSKNGYLPDIIPPKKFRLARCWTHCDKLILISTGDKNKSKKYRVFMPKDDLYMDIEIGVVASISKKSVKPILNKVQPKKSSSLGDVIDFDSVFERYGQPIIDSSILANLADYSIDTVLANRGKLQKELLKKVQVDTKDTPIQVKVLTINNVDPPASIVKQKKAAAEKKIKVIEEKAKKEIELVKIQTQLEKAKANRRVKIERAQSVADENKILGDSVDSKYITYKKLEIMQTIAERSNNSVMIPFEMLSSVGASNHAFKELKRGASK